MGMRVKKTTTIYNFCTMNIPPTVTKPYKKVEKLAENCAPSGKAKQVGEKLQYIETRLPFGQLSLEFLFAMDLKRLATLFMMLSACSSVPVVRNTVQSSRAFLTPKNRVLQKCLTTCLEGRQSQVCFDESINDAIPAPVLPDYICKSIGCRKPTGTCPTEVTTFPFQCMLRGDSGLIQSDVDGIESVCNVPVERMKTCSFNPTLGSSAQFSHGQEVTFETQRRNSTERKSKTCFCYDGQWIGRNAVDGTKVMKKNANRFICNVHNSSKYLRVKNVMEPIFPNDGVFVQKCREVLLNRQRL